jgi:hypothetical protein
MEAIVRVNGMDVTDLVLLRAMVPRAPHMRPTKNAPITAPAKVPAENPAVGVDPPAAEINSIDRVERHRVERGGGKGRLKQCGSGRTRDKRDKRNGPEVGVMVTIVVFVPVVLLLPMRGSLLFSFSAPPWGCNGNVTGVLTDLLIPLLYRVKLSSALYPTLVSLKIDGNSVIEKGKGREEGE